MKEIVEDTGIVQKIRCVPENKDDIRDWYQNRMSESKKDNEDKLQDILNQLKLQYPIVVRTPQEQQRSIRSLSNHAAIAQREAVECFGMFDSKLKEIYREFEAFDEDCRFVEDPSALDAALGLLLSGIRIGELLERIKHVRPYEPIVAQDKRASEKRRTGLKKGVSNRVQRADSIAEQAKAFVSGKMKDGLKKGEALKAAAKKFKKDPRTIRNWLNRSNLSTG